MAKIDLLILLGTLISCGISCLGMLYLRRYIRWPSLFATQVRWGCLVTGSFLLLSLAGIIFFARR